MDQYHGTQLGKVARLLPVMFIKSEYVLGMMQPWHKIIHGELIGYVYGSDLVFTEIDHATNL